MNTRVVRLSADNTSDFYKVHSGECGWCYCTAWWTSTWEGWTDRQDEDNRKLRDSLFEGGEYDGYLLYIDELPVGWCQVGRRDRLKKLISQYKLEANPEIWAITCFVIKPKYRGIGLADSLLKAILEDLKGRGVKEVEAFPNRTHSTNAGEHWRGPESLFDNAGFKVKRDDPNRPVFSINLNS
jgi:GNAT superfamily N-acetyltransferase